MDEFSVIVLGRTAELIAEMMEPESHLRIADCLRVINRYVEEPDFVNETEFHRAVITLLDLAREGHHVLIAARLASIVTRLSETFDYRDAA